MKRRSIAKQFLLALDIDDECEFIRGTSAKCFGGGSRKGGGQQAAAPPAPIPPPPPPTVEDADQRSEQEAARMRARAGRASTILTGKADGDSSQPTTATKQLLGS